MKNNKINSKNEYLNSIINNDSNNDNSIIDLENHFKNLNINARPNKNIKKGKIYLKITLSIHLLKAITSLMT